MIYTEMTPNPASLKFVVDTILVGKGSRDYPDPASAEGESRLAQKLFEFNFIQRVFLGHNFVTVTKPETEKWETIIPLVKNTIKTFLESGTPVLENEPDAEPEADLEEDEVVRQIKQLLDQNIRPAVAMDGGDVVFDHFDEGVVKLKLQGSCSGCPSSTMTLKMGIEGLLTRMIPEVKKVEAVDA